MINQKGKGNGEIINSIIVSHNSRIRCLLDKFITSKEEIRFMNWCILLLKITCTHLELELIYTGELEIDSQKKQIKKILCNKYRKWKY